MRARVPRMMVTEHEHRDRGDAAARSSSHSSCSRGMRPRSVPGRTVSSTASVTPSRLDREGPGRRDLCRCASRRGCRARGACGHRAACTRRGTTAYSSSVPRFGEIALHDDRVGIERARSRRSRPRSSPPGTAARPVPRTKTGPSSSGVPSLPHSASPKCTSLTVATVASSATGRPRRASSPSPAAAATPRPRRRAAGTRSRARAR